MNSPSAPPVAAPRARPQSVDADHAHAHGHDHRHGVHAGGHDHGPTQDRPVASPGPSLLRASLGARLAIAGGLSALIWAAVAWARLPIAG